MDWKHLSSSRSFPPSFPAPLQEAVRRYQAAQVRWLTLGWMARCGVTFLVPFLAGIFLDRYFDLPVAVRLIPPATAVLLILLATVWLLAAPLWRGNLEILAGEVDAAQGQSRDALRSSMNLLGQAEREPDCFNRFMLDQTVQDAETAFSGASTGRFVRAGRTPHWLVLLGLLAVVTLGLTFDPEMQMDLLTRRFFNPLGNYPRPSRTRIRVEAPPAQTLTQGDDFDVRVQLSGHVEEGMGSFLHLRDRGDAENVLPMSPRPSHHFVSSLKNLSRSLEFFVTAGDGRTQRFRIEVAPRPRITRMIARYKFPGYTGMAASEEPVKFREIKAVEGTRVQILLDTDQEIQDSWADIAGKRQKIRWDRSGRQGTISFTLDRSGSLKIHLATRDGRTNKFDSPYILKVIPDSPPVVSFVQIPDHLTFFRDDLIRFSYKGTDDFGIAEVFVRFKHPESRENFTLSLDFTRAGAKEFSGEAVLEIRELIDRGPYSEEAQGLEISVVMLDSKDQEGSTQKLSIQIISDTPDRQLAELNQFLGGFYGSLQDAAGTLQGQAGQIKILVEAMNDDTEFTPKHDEMLRGIRAQLGRIGFPDPVSHYDRNWKVFRYGQYPLAAGHAAEEIITLPFSFWQGGTYLRRLAESDGQSRRRPALAALQALALSQQALIEPWKDALTESLRENRVQILSFTLDQYLLAAAALSARPASDRENDALYQEKQAERLAAIARTTHEIGALEDEPAQAAARRLDQAAQDPKPAPENTLRLVQDLQARLDESPELDGHHRKALHDYLKAHPLPERIRTARQDHTLHSLAHALLLKIILRSDNPFSDDDALFLECVALQAIQRNDPAQLDAALPILDQSLAWSQQSDVLQRVLLLRRDISDWSADRTAGRLQVESAATTQRWLELRENFLAFLGDARAGAFDALDHETLSAIEALQPLAPLFRRWSWVLVDPKAYDDGTHKAAERLQALADRLRPGYEKGLESLRPAVQSLLLDVAANLRAEVPFLRLENQQFEAEVRQSIESVSHLAALSDTERKARLKEDRGRAHPDRIGNAISLVQRLTGYSAAVGLAIDFQERSWAWNPSGPATGEVKAAENLSEFLRYLHEQTYDRAVAPHLRAQYTSMVYPGYLKEIVRYYEETIPAIEQASNEIALLAQGKGESLLASEEFTKRLSRIQKQQSYRETLFWVESHADLVGRMDEAAGADPLRALLGEIAHHHAFSTPYWQQLDHALQEANQTPWSLGQPAEARGQALRRIEQALERIDVLTRGLDPTPDELKPLPQALEDFHRLKPRLQATQAAMPSQEQQASLIDDLEDWRGRVLALRESIESRTLRPAVRYRNRRRYGTNPRFDLDWILNRILRLEARWTERLADEEHRVISERIETVLARLRGDAEGDRLHRQQLAWQTAHLLASRHKSQTAQSQQSQGLTWTLESEGTRQPKMPEYLYQELKRAMKKNYPEHFRELGLRYLRGLSEDAF
ncbi:MAG: hypothetical protein HYU36_18430 [Planctomycetes bacterium]|nr:hypothetical protein [Planctomycetota bacterium]